MRKLPDWFKKKLESEFPDAVILWEAPFWSIYRKAKSGNARPGIVMEHSGEHERVPVFKERNTFDSEFEPVGEFDGAGIYKMDDKLDWQGYWCGPNQEPRDVSEELLSFLRYRRKYLSSTTGYQRTQNGVNQELTRQARQEDLKQGLSRDSARTLKFARQPKVLPGIDDCRRLGG